MMISECDKPIHRHNNDLDELNKLFLQLNGFKREIVKRVNTKADQVSPIMFSFGSQMGYPNRKSQTYFLINY